MSDRIIELVKNPTLPNEKTIKVDVLKEENIGVGGAEGVKFGIHFELKNKFKTREAKLITKRLRYFKGVEAPNLVNAYKTAHKEGFITPETVRYTKEGEDDILMMSDMSEGGKYIIWGYNDHSTKKEHAAYRELNLSKSDIQEIKSQGMKYVEKANSLDRSLWFYNYHIRKDKETGKLELFLLDLDPHYMQIPHGPNMNQENFERFFKVLGAEPEEHKKLL